MENNNVNLVKSNEILNLAILAIDEGQKLGSVKDILIECSEQNKLLFLVENGELEKDSKVIQADDVIRIGEDALVVENQNKVKHSSKEPEFLSRIKNSCRLRGTSVLSVDNKELGKVSDLSIDREKVELLELDIVDEKGENNRRFSLKEIIDIKDSYIIVEDTPDSASTVDENIEKNTTYPTLVKESTEHEGDTEAAKAEEGATSEEAHKKISAKEEKAAEKKVEKSETHTANKDLKQILEERQTKFILGKKVSRDIVADDGTALIKEGEKITKETIEKAKAANKFLVLSFSIETDLAKGSKNDK